MGVTLEVPGSETASRGVSGAHRGHLADRLAWRQCQLRDIARNDGEWHHLHHMPHCSQADDVALPPSQQNMTRVDVHGNCGWLDGREWRRPHGRGAIRRDRGKRMGGALPRTMQRSPLAGGAVTSNCRRSPPRAKAASCERTPDVVSKRVVRMSEAL